METTLYEILQSGTPFQARMLVAKAEIIAYLVKQFDGGLLLQGAWLIERIALWTGERITDTFEEEGYCYLCLKVYEQATQFDPGCSKMVHDLYAFVSEAITLGYALWVKRVDQSGKLATAVELERQAAALREEVRLAQTKTA